MNEANHSRSGQQNSSTHDSHDDEGAGSLQRETQPTLMEYLSDNLQVELSYTSRQSVLSHTRINFSSTQINIKPSFFIRKTHIRYKRNKMTISSRRHWRRGRCSQWCLCGIARTCLWSTRFLRAGSTWLFRARSATAPRRTGSAYSVTLCTALAMLIGMPCNTRRSANTPSHSASAIFPSGATVVRLISTIL